MKEQSAERTKQEIRELALNTLEKVAKSSNGRNKKELLEMLNRLKGELI